MPGRVVDRGANENDKLATGAVEVEASVRLQEEVLVRSSLLDDVLQADVAVGTELRVEEVLGGRKLSRLVLLLLHQLGRPRRAPPEQVASLLAVVLGQRRLVVRACLLQLAADQRHQLPYLRLVQAVRVGDLALFKAAFEEHSAAFAADGNLTLVMRLRQNVIRAGLRNISLAYSRISLSEVATKLSLDHAEDMESIAAKAIRDGVIDASLDHAAGVIISKEAHDVYSTLEPQAAFHKRITFCLNVHNDAVKAMSYPPDAHKGELPDAETLKERQREEQELAQSLAEDDYD